MAKYTVFVPTGLTRLDTDDAGDTLRACTAFIGTTICRATGMVVFSPTGDKAAFVVNNDAEKNPLLSQAAE